jgi:hypothetical protein
MRSAFFLVHQFLVGIGRLGMYPAGLAGWLDVLRSYLSCMDCLRPRVLLQLAKAIAVASTTRGVALYEQYDLSASQEWVF